MYVDICVDTSFSHCAVLNALCTAIVEAFVALITPGAARKRVLSRVHPTSSPRKKMSAHPTSSPQTARHAAVHHRQPMNAASHYRQPTLCQ
eukprot:3111891-Heterocapsa_arctica.AAC.1